MNTLLLDQTAWDLVVDSEGNIAMATGAYAIAQDVASACRLFLGELWFDTTRGIAWFQIFDESPPPVSFIQAQCNAAALTVPGVVEAQTVITGLLNQNGTLTVTGSVEFSTTAGELLSANMSFSVSPPAPSAAAPANALLDINFVLDESRLA